MDSLLFHYLIFWKPAAYAGVFLGMILEGEAALFAAAFLTRRGFLDVEGVIFVVFSGLIIGDLLWYRFGRLLGDSENFLNRWSHRFAGPHIDEHLKHRSGRTIFISKFVYGLHHLILMRAGSLKIDLKKFIKIDLAAIVVWFLIVGGVGYFFSDSHLLLKKYFKFVEITLAFGIIAFLLFWRVIDKFLKKLL